MRLEIRLEKKTERFLLFSLRMFYFCNNEYDSSTPFIMVCGLGNTYKKDTPQKATVRDITSTTFLVDTSDDASRNDGNFQFMIYQFLMW